MTKSGFAYVEQEQAGVVFLEKKFAVTPKFVSGNKIEIPFPYGNGFTLEEYEVLDTTIHIDQHLNCEVVYELVSSDGEFIILTEEEIEAAYVGTVQEV